jgi:hypothetical protein
VKVYIRQSTDRELSTINCANAAYGFRLIGWEIDPYESIADIPDLQPDEVVVGYISDIHAALTRLGIEPPLPINYPPELDRFLGRKIWLDRVNNIVDRPELWNIFIKPALKCKKFTGKLITTSQDLIGCGDETEDSEIWCSEPVNFLSEWRCFVRYDRILGVHLYNGDWRLPVDANVVEAAIAAYRSAPAAYAIDFGVTDTGETLLVEVNDGYATGNYGLPPLYYAQFLASRWAEMTDADDYSISISQVFC